MKGIRIAVSVAVAALVVASGYAALFIAPDEKTMHLVQRIFYFHVPSWSASFTAFTIVFVANIAYLSTRQLRWDWLGVSAAEVGVAICSIGLLTGPLWARPVWGIWWTWDARLTTTLVLWLIYVSYLVLRRFSNSAQTQMLAAALAVFGALDVPLVYFSIWFFRTQHPQPVIGGGGSMDPHMLQVLLISWMAFLCFAFLVCWSRFRLEVLRREIEEAHAMESLVGAGDASKASLPLSRGSR
jgi:heme exporter protein C